MTFTSEIKVELVQSMGSDEMTCGAARVSTGAINTNITETEKRNSNDKLINSLLKHKHGTPFEHNSLTFRVEAPIFVWREHHRHRIGFSFNEESARYKQLEAKFWLPSRFRKCKPVLKISDCHQCRKAMLPGLSGLQLCDCGFKWKYHTSMNPLFEAIETEREFDDFIRVLKTVYTFEYEQYQTLIHNNYAKEVARVLLPVGIYSSCFVTCNCRSLMHFLSLRTHDETADFISNPQAEIEEVARKYEEIFAQQFPLTYKAYSENGRVAP